MFKPVRMSKAARSPDPVPMYMVLPSRSSVTALIGDSLKSIDITGLL